MAESSTATSTSIQVPSSSDHITEDEASLYDRQIRLWGLEAQNRMRSSTVLLLSLRSLAHETIKNLVLAGIGRLIIMDDGVVTEEDLGGGFLFREEEGCVGQERTMAASPQISSLNPLVSLTALPTLAPFLRDKSTDGADVDGTEEMVGFLKREKVDVVIACDMDRSALESIDEAARKAGVMFHGAGTYGFYGYVFADLGGAYPFVISPPANPSNPSPPLVKKILSYPSLSSAFEKRNWEFPASRAAQGGSPYRGLSRMDTKNQAPGVAIGILALWEFESRHRKLPTGQVGEQDELAVIAESLRKDLGVSSKVLPSIDSSMMEHLTNHATHFFPPTLAILGGFLAQDVLRSLSKKDKPITNLLCVDSMGGIGSVGRWGMDDARDALE